jgi:glutamine amidotransferase
MLAILDYKAGNQTSVRRALDHLGIPCRITADPAVIADASGIIFPGVGAAGQAMHELTSTGLDTLLAAQVAAGKPLLGICVGCQILLDYSAENDTKALGIIPGACAMFSPDLTDEDGQPIRIPHMGWNRVALQAPCPLFDGIEPEAEFYFVHSAISVPKRIHPRVRPTACRFVLTPHGTLGVQFHRKKAPPGPHLCAFRRYFEEATTNCQTRLPADVASAAQQGHQVQGHVTSRSGGTAALLRKGGQLVFYETHGSSEAGDHAAW